MASTTSRGNYYKRKSKQYYENLGYTVQLTEFMCGMVIKGRCIYRKIDIFGSDGIAMNGKEIIFWNSKHLSEATQNDANNRNTQLREGAKEFNKYPFPETVKKQLILWQPRKKPTIIEV